MKRIMIVMILIFFQSCLHRDIKNNITELLNKKIIIPENLEAIKGEYIQDSAEIHAPIKLVIHYSPESCSNCALAHLSDYEMWHNLSFASDSKLKILFIFTPSQTQYEILLQQISQLQIQDTIYIDKSGNFLTENKDILKNYNAFLLNKRGEIVLVGDPIANKSMIELYRKTLDNMLANDGRYIPE